MYWLVSVLILPSRSAASNSLVRASVAGGAGGVGGATGGAGGAGGGGGGGGACVCCASSKACSAASSGFIPEAINSFVRCTILFWSSGASCANCARCTSGLGMTLLGSYISGDRARRAYSSTGSLRKSRSAMSLRRPRASAASGAYFSSARSAPRLLSMAPTVVPAIAPDWITVCLRVSPAASNRSAQPALGRSPNSGALSIRN